MSPGYTIDMTAVSFTEQLVRKYFISCESLTYQCRDIWEIFFLIVLKLCYLLRLDLREVRQDKMDRLLSVNNQVASQAMSDSTLWITKKEIADGK